jgi:hypothetical protein
VTSAAAAGRPPVRVPSKAPRMVRRITWMDCIIHLRSCKTDNAALSIEAGRLTAIAGCGDECFSARSRDWPTCARATVSRSNDGGAHATGLAGRSLWSRPAAAAEFVAVPDMPDPDSNHPRHDEGAEFVPDTRHRAFQIRQSGHALQGVQPLWQGRLIASIHLFLVQSRPKQQGF